MAGPLDAQYNLGVESTYGTGVTPGRTYEWDLENSTHQWDPMPVQGTGMQVGDGAFERADRSVAVIGRGSGTVAMDYQTKGMGLIVAGALGNGVSSLVSGTTYQELFTGSLATSLLQSFTTQYGIVRSDAAGTVDTYTYLGTTFDTMTASCAAGEVMKFSTDWDAKARTEATGLAAAAYPANLLTPFHYGQFAVSLGGTITVPTTIAIGSATGGTAVNDVKSFSFNLNNNTDKERWVMGSRNQPRVSKREATLTIATEYNGVSYDQAQTAHTTLPLILTATSDQALSTGFAQWQLVLPACKVTSTNRPNPSSSTPTVEYTLSVKKPATGSAIYIVHRTSAATL